jgi:hypothetical protein
VVKRVFLIVSLVLAGYVTLDLYRVWQLRREPRMDGALEILTSRLPHAPLLRAFLLAPGSPEYDETVREWTYAYASVPDTIGDRWVLAKDVLRMSAGDQQRYLGQLSVTPLESLAPLLNGPVKALDVSCEQSDEPEPEGDVAESEEADSVHNAELDPYRLLLVWQRTPGQAERYHEWVKRHLVDQRCEALFQNAARYVVQSDAGPWPQVLERHWDVGWDARGFLEDQAEWYAPDWADEWRVIVANIDTEGQLARLALRDLSESLSVGKRASDRASMMFIGAMLASNSLRDEALDAIRTNASRLDPSFATDLFSFFECEPEQSESPEEFDEYHIEEVEAEQPEHSESPDEVCIEPAEVALELFQEFRSANPELASEFFHEIAHNWPAQAREIGREALNGPDSVLRKGILVMLVRHDYQVANSKIDEAFMGTAPRRSKFYYVYSYTEATAAARRYGEIAGHDYRETGKTWPPSGSSNDTPEQWRAFIEQYPWFPGSDDATYRMLFRTLEAGRLDTVIAETARYFESEHPDRDAEGLIRLTAFEAVMGAPSQRPSDPTHELMRGLVTEPAARVLVGQVPVDRYASRVDQLARDKKLAHGIGLSDADVAAMQDVATALGRNTIEQRIVGIEEVVSREPHRVALALYGDPVAEYAFVPDGVGASEVGRAVASSAEGLASFLKTRLATASPSERKAIEALGAVHGQSTVSYISDPFLSRELSTFGY